MKTYGRLRSKFGSTLEDVELPPFTIEIGESGWRFIGELKDKLPKNIVDRFRMIYIPDNICTVHDGNKCYCYEIKEA